MQATPCRRLRMHSRLPPCREPPRALPRHRKTSMPTPFLWLGDDVLTHIMGPPEHVDLASVTTLVCTCQRLKALKPNYIPHLSPSAFSFLFRAGGVPGTHVVSLWLHRSRTTALLEWQVALEVNGLKVRGNVGEVVQVAERLWSDKERVEMHRMLEDTHREYVTQGKPQELGTQLGRQIVAQQLTSISLPFTSELEVLDCTANHDGHPKMRISKLRPYLAASPRMMAYRPAAAQRLDGADVAGHDVVVLYPTAADFASGTNVCDGRFPVDIVIDVSGLPHHQRKALKLKDNVCVPIPVQAALCMAYFAKQWPARDSQMRSMLHARIDEAISLWPLWRALPALRVVDTQQA